MSHQSHPFACGVTIEGLYIQVSRPSRSLSWLCSGRGHAVRWMSSYCVVGRVMLAWCLVHHTVEWVDFLVFCQVCGLGVVLSGGRGVVSSGGCGVVL